MKPILPIWQPVGYSTYQITNAIAKHTGQVATHTGVLDPLAEGVIIVLTGDERFNKFKYSTWHKTYEFEIAFGISTDSFDGMGFVSNMDLENSKVSKTEIEYAAKSFTGPYTQTVPIYSAQKYKGKKLFTYAKKNVPIPDLPKKSGQIYFTEVLNVKEVKLKHVISEVISKLKTVEGGEFRQNETSHEWQKLLLAPDSENLVTIAKIRVEMSKGLYVRSLSQDIAQKLGKSGFVTSLVRTRNGEYAKNNSLSLEDIFKEKFDKKLFVSKYNS